MRKYFRESIAAKFRFLGGNVVLWMTIASFTALVGGAVEFSVASFLQLFMKSLGFVTDVKLPFGVEINRSFSLNELALILLVIGIFRGLSQFFVSMSNVVVMEITHRRFRNLLISRIFESKIHPSSSEVSLRLSEVNPKAAQAVASASYFFTVFVQLSIVASAMFSIAPREALFGLTGLILTGFLVIKCNRLVYRSASQVVGQQENIVKTVQRVLRNWLLVTILRTDKKEMQHLRKSVDVYCQNSISAGKWTYLGAVISPTFGIFIIVSIILFHQSAKGTTEIGFLSFLYLFIRFAQDAGTCARYAGTLVSAKPYLNILYKDFFTFENEQNASSKPKTIKSVETQRTYLAPTFKIEDLVFAYPGSRSPVVNLGRLNVASGSQVGIVGESGSGKSTLLLLMLGLLKPNSGSIAISDQDPVEYFSKFGETVSYVGPDPFMIEGTVRENINYGNPNPISDAEITELLTLVKLGDVIFHRSEKLDTFLSDEGSGFSAGQKQRLSLARALARKPSLLILDEATSNLDEETEKEISSVLMRLKGQMTCIVVSHRPGILIHADFVLRLDSNKATQTE